MKHIFYVLLFSVLCACNTSKEIEETTFPEDEIFQKFTAIIDNYAEAILKRGNANSFALAVYKDGNIYQNYYGEIDKGANNKPNDSSLYEIASITKTFTGALVAKAVLANAIKLDDDIRKYLGGDYPNLEFEGHPITVQHLLTHSLGFKTKTPKRLEAFNEKMNRGQTLSEAEMYTIEDLLEELKAVEVDKKPGTKFVYNSVGPELLAYILEQVNKQPFKAQVNTFLTDIGMHNTYLQESEKHTSKLVQGYKGKTKAFTDYSPIYGAAGGAISTLPDMAMYMRYLVDNKETPWIKEASRILFTDNEDDDNIGYLWQNIGFAEEEGYFYSKTGTSNGIQSGVLICPDSDYGIVVIVNNTSEDAFNDWATLFFRDIEPDVIKYPKLNLFSSLKEEFKSNPKSVFSEFKRRRADTARYFIDTSGINNFGYELLNDGKHNEALEVFTFFTEEFPENANAYDSLGEAYFSSEDLDNALLNYKKSLELNPNNTNAKAYIQKIEDIKNQNND